jgi:hypothetical protein
MKSMGIGSYLFVACALATNLVGCAAEIGDENIEAEREALVNGGISMGADGRIDVTSMHVFNAMRATDWPTKSPKRYSIVDWADWENYAENMDIYGDGPGEGMCGATAKAHYGTDANLWCTEYSSWVLRRGGLRNIRYCKTSFLGICGDYEYLDEASTVSDMVDLFLANGGWVKRANIGVDTIEPGDYMAMTTNGIRKNHSVIVMAVSSDRRHFYTSEGNSGDCVRFGHYYLYDGNGLNPIIDGIGKVNVAF